MASDPWDSLFEEVEAPAVATKRGRSSIWSHFKDALMEGAVHSGAGAEPVARANLKRQGWTAEQINEGERRVIKGIEQRRAERDEQFKDVDTLSPANLGKWTVDLAGNVIGGVDPTYILNPGATILRRIGAQAGINFGVDALSQGQEVRRKIKKGYDLRQGLLAGAGGAALQGAGEVVGHARLGRKVNNGSKMPGWQAVNDVIVNDLEGGGTLARPKVSPKGAMGPQQVMPETARKPGFGIRPWNGKSQADLARVGRQYSAAMMNKYDGDVAKVLAAYNGGPGRVDGLIKKYGDDWAAHLPRETRNYVEKGMGRVFGTADAVDNLPRGWTQPPEPIGDIRLTQDELPSPDEMARVNEALAPDIMRQAEDDSANLQDLFKREDPNFREGGPVGVDSSDVDMGFKEPTVPVPPHLRDVVTKREWDDMPEGLRQQEAMKAKNQEDITFPDEYLNPTRPALEEPKRGPKDFTGSSSQGYTPPGMISPKELDVYLKTGRVTHERGANSPALSRDMVKSYFGDKADDILADADKNKTNGVGYTFVDGWQVRIVDDPNFSDRPLTNRVDREAPVSSSDVNLGPTKPKNIIKDLFDDESGSFNPWGTKRTASGRRESVDPASLEPEERLTHVLKRLQKLSPQQKKLHSQERARRAGPLGALQEQGGGRENFYKQKGSLKGEFPNVDFESIAKHFSDDDIADIFNRVNFSNSMGKYEKMSALEALDGLLRPEGAKLPTPYERALLERVFSEDFIKALLSNRSAMEKFWNDTTNALNIPRALMSSFDLSAPFRQGIGFVGRKEFWKAMGPMFRVLVSEKNSKALMQSIYSDPKWEKAKKAGLAIVDPHSHHLAGREEDFMSDMAERIPGIGRGVKASNRAYSGFLNKLRWDVYNDMVKKYEAAGVNVDDKKRRNIANFVNTFSGRGDWGTGPAGKALNQATPLLTAVFFSPKLITSRVKMLASPLTYMAADPILRKEALKSLLAYSAYVGSSLYIAKEFLGADVETDPRSPDFAKAKWGNTRRDTTGGLASYVSFGAKMLSGSKITNKGEEQELAGGFNDAPEGQYEDSLGSVVGRFSRSKLAPIPAKIIDFLTGENVVGEPFWRNSKLIEDKTGLKVNSSILDLFIPMTLSDLYEVDQDGGFMKAIGLAPGAIMGESVQTYKPREKEAKPKKDEFDKLFDTTEEVKKDEWDKLFEEME